MLVLATWLVVGTDVRRCTAAWLIAYRVDSSVARQVAQKLAVKNRPCVSYNRYISI